MLNLKSNIFESNFLINSNFYYFYFNKLVINPIDITIEHFISSFKLIIKS